MFMIQVLEEILVGSLIVDELVVGGLRDELVRFGGLVGRRLSLATPGDVTVVQGDHTYGE